MKQEEKDTVMEAFALGNIDILVSTVVIEVGIDVGNATIMVIENCERFGLAQLHQLRGRVGRSSIQSYCVLIAKEYQERLKFLETCSDGFKISEEDFKDYIEVAIGQKDGIRKKPAPDTVVQALKELGKTKERAVYVGDSEVDFATAKNSGMDCVLVTWGFRNLEELKEFQPVAFVDTAEQLQMILEQA